MTTRTLAQIEIWVGYENVKLKLRRLLTTPNLRPTQQRSCLLAGDTSDGHNKVDAWTGQALNL